MPIRWRILSIAALNSAVVIVLAVLIWNGAQVLGSAWEDVRQVRESDKILARLESETSRLQNLIHRYINQPNSGLFAEILLLREAVLGTLTRRASTDPMLGGSVAQLEHATERFLNGFGELRTVQSTITKTYQEQVLAPAKDIAALYSVIEGATGHHDARSGPRSDSPARPSPRRWSRPIPIICRWPPRRPRTPAATPRRSRRPCR